MEEFLFDDLTVLPVCDRAELDMKLLVGRRNQPTFWTSAGLRAFGRLFHVRFSGESRDIPKCRSALAGLRHHPDSGKHTLEEIGHAV